MHRKTHLDHVGTVYPLFFIKDDQQTMLSIIIHVVSAVLTWLKYSGIASQLHFTDAPNI